MTNFSSTNLTDLFITYRDSSTEELYRAMLGIRTFETSLLNMFEGGALAGTTHTCLGQESSAVGVLSAIDRAKDIVFSNHRCHGHFLSYCAEAERLYYEIIGHPKGVCAGRGGSQHLYFKNFYSNGVQGGIVPVATGMALAEKRKQTGSVAVVFLGDGTLGEGVVYESWNMASLWQIPVLYVIDHNGYAQSTPSNLQMAGSVPSRPEAFGIPTTEVDGRDVGGILKEASSLVDVVRSEATPRCLLIHSQRLGPHSKGDDSRSDEEIQEAKQLDPLALLSQNIEPTQLQNIEKQVSCLFDILREDVFKEQ